MEKLQSEKQFEVLKQEERTVFMFSADWCPDCRVIDPLLPGIEADYPENEFVYVDRDQFIDICAENDIFGIPSFLVYSNGKELGRFVSKDRKTREDITAFLDNPQAK
ncbi:thioredoxin family protein [Sporosarcina sp. A2]|uniref:thioredoxin family protein n=1 Tax=Sporosarcina sp. A2 TaxID=3393449 RepID=UPI003D7B1134